MNKKNIPTIIVLLLIFLFAFFIRTFNLSGIPPGLNRDEAAIGYTAYSLLKSGIDEYGNRFPLSFRSFGDWKLPLYIYLTVPFIRLFGLTEFATRLPSAFLGSITVLLVYFLTQQLLLLDRKIKPKIITLVSLLASFFLAINPWHIFMSRNASESNVAVFLVTLATVLLLHSFKKYFLLPVSFFVLSLSLYTYHGNHIFTPLLFIGILIFFGKKLKSNRLFLWACGVFIASSFFIFSQTLFSADRTKISGLFPLGDQFQLHEMIELARGEHGDSLLTKLLHNKGVFLVTTIVNNYLRSFSPEFLFIKGGANTQHNIPGFGNLYPWEGLFILIAFYWLIREKKLWGFFLLYWFFISAVAPSITRDAPHTNRMMPILPIPDILAAFGMYFVWNSISYKKIKQLFLTGVPLIIVLYTTLFFDRYFVHFPFQAVFSWGGSYPTLISSLQNYEKKGKPIVMERPGESPYIYFLFYRHFDPRTFIKEVSRYPDTSDGFSHVESFDHYTFKPIDWSVAMLTPGYIFVDWVEGVPWEATGSSRLIGDKELLLLKKSPFSPIPSLGTRVQSRLLQTIYATNGKPQWYIIETSQE